MLLGEEAFPIEYNRWAPKSHGSSRNSSFSSSEADFLSRDKFDRHRQRLVIVDDEGGAAEGHQMHSSEDHWSDERPFKVLC